MCVWRHPKRHRRRSLRYIYIYIYAYSKCIAHHIRFFSRPRIAHMQIGYRIRLSPDYVWRCPREWATAHAYFTLCVCVCACVIYIFILLYLYTTTSYPSRGKGVYYIIVYCNNWCVSCCHTDYDAIIQERFM